MRRTFLDSFSFLFVVEMWEVRFTQRVGRTWVNFILRSFLASESRYVFVIT